MHQINYLRKNPSLSRSVLEGLSTITKWDLFQECNASWSTLVPSLRSSGPAPCSAPLKNTQQKGQLRTDILWFSYLYHLTCETPAIPRAFSPISNMLILLDHNNSSLLFVFQRPWENLFVSLKFHGESYFIFNWRIITLQYCNGFCHTWTWIRHRFTHVLSLLNFPPTSLPIPPL